jgi:phospholipid-translocating ATPase
MIPVFSLVLDKDVDENLALLYPELYKELTLGKTLSYKTFFVWVLVSIYQGMFSYASILIGGCVIMILTNILVGIEREQWLISVSFTALVLNELVMIALEIHTWHKYMIFSEIATFACYFVSIPFLGDYFGTYFFLLRQLTQQICRISLLWHLYGKLQSFCWLVWDHLGH